MNKMLLSAIGGLVLLGASVGASAATISGTLEIGGLAPKQTDLSTATAFSAAGAYLMSSSGDDLSEVQTTNLSIHNFNFDPLDSGGSLVWSSSAANEFSFTLTSVGIGPDPRTDSFLNLEGFGVLKSTNASFEDTLATFTLTFTQQDSSMRGVLGITTVAPVPLPAAAWLFGSALIGIGSIARHNRKNEKPGQTTV